MPLYLTQVAYTPEAWKSLVKNPHDRMEAVRPAVEQLGGKIVNGYFAFGDYDAVVIVDLPNHVSAAALAIAFAAGGACKNVKTTPLLTTAEAVEALKQAGRTDYRPATAAAGATA
ncbi:MAG TPA: GYD domain-containing protein [Candidatus Acidoferrales bacterium]|jgi:uncharacterized protein with GYD domain|nr:GYD domain-containing protein [Candidatus Acidoferrales bacterium]